MAIYEDVFGGGNAIELIIRWHEKAIVDFNKYNTKTYEQIKQIIDSKELKCLFLKVKELEQRIIIPIADADFQFEIYAEWDEKLFSHTVKVKANKKTRVATPISLPEEKQYFIEETCRIVFIDINDSRFPVREQLELFQRVANLEISPKTKTENDLEIWNKYIQAQDILLKRYAQPFPVKRYYPPLEIKSESGNVTRYKFKVDLHVYDSTDYKEIEEELRTEFEIFEHFDSEGNIKLKYNDINRGLDLVIEKKFKGVLEREKIIKCILQIRALPTCDLLANELKTLMPDCKISADFKTGQISIFSSNTRVNQIPPIKIDEFGLKRLGVVATFIVKENYGKTSYSVRKKLLSDRLNRKDFEQAKYSFGAEIINDSRILARNPNINHVSKVIIGGFKFQMQQI